MLISIERTYDIRLRINLEWILSNPELIPL
jgi:hypothetical protein